MGWHASPNSVILRSDQTADHDVLAVLAGMSASDLHVGVGAAVLAVVFVFFARG